MVGGYKSVNNFIFYVSPYLKANISAYLAEKYDYIKCSPPVSDNEPITKCSITEKGILFIKNTVYQKKPQIWMKITDEMRDELIKAK